MSSNLTDKQKAFCDYYLIDFNATQAAIKAGYSQKTARAIANENLTKPDIQIYLQSKLEKLTAKLEISQERTLLEIGRVAFQDARSFFYDDGSLIPIHLLTDDAAAVIAGMDIEELFEYADGEKNKIGHVKKIKRWDKGKALEMLAKYYKMYSDAPVNNNTVNAPMTDDQVDKVIKSLRENKNKAA